MFVRLPRCLGNLLSLSLSSLVFWFVIPELLTLPQTTTRQTTTTVLHKDEHEHTTHKGKTEKPHGRPPKPKFPTKEEYEKYEKMLNDSKPFGEDDGNEYAEINLDGVDFETELIRHHVVPDYIHAVPDFPLEIHYKYAVVKYGNKLTYEETKYPPRIIKWHYDEEKYYTIMLVDPDGPFGNARDHEEEWHHWLVTNIYGSYVDLGDPYAAYIGVVPSRGKHIHRYIFLVYEQPGNKTIDFDEIHLGTEPIDMLRGYFSAKEFAKKYNLTGPIACNFFLSDWSKAPPIPSTTEKPYTINQEDLDHWGPPDPEPED